MILEKNGWTITKENNPAYPLGSEYNNIAHNGFSFAKQIVIHKVIIEIIDDNGSILTKSLTYDDFEVFVDPVIEEPVIIKPVLSTVTIIGVFDFIEPIERTSWRTKESVFGAGKDRLCIWYLTSVGIYGNDPPHEFTGGLQAANFKPKIRFSTTNKNILSIRVDYKLSLNADSYIDMDKLGVQIPKASNKKLKSENFCSIIQDADSFPPVIVNFLKFIDDLINYYNTPTKVSVFFKEKIINLALSVVSDLDFSMEYVANKISINISIKNRTNSSLPTLFKIDLTKDQIKFLNAKNNFSPETALNLAKFIANRLHRQTLGMKDGAGKEYNKLYESTNINLLNKKFEIDVIKIYEDQALKKLTDEQAAILSDKFVKKMRNDMPPKLLILFEALLEPSSLKKILGVPPLLIIIGGLGHIIELNGWITSYIAFSFAEKPVLNEMVGFFNNGYDSTSYEEDRKSWDNLHWWGTKKIPSAPGAFHAIHSHFHWANFTAYPITTDIAITNFLDLMLGSKEVGKGSQNFGKEQFKSAIDFFKDKSLSGPLIDPDIPNQTIQFAITKRDSKLYKAIENLPPQSFKEIADQIKHPELIAKIDDGDNSGEDIIYWLSFRATKSADQTVDTFQGVFFINGFYFAHNAEKPFSLTEPTNAFAITQGVDIQKPKRLTKDDLIFREPI